MLDLTYLLARNDVRTKLETAAEQLADPMAPLIGRGIRNAFETLDDYAELGLTPDEVEEALALAVRSRNTLDDIRRRVVAMQDEHEMAPEDKELPQWALTGLQDIINLLDSDDIKDPDYLLDEREGRVT
jgi:hypothetical protein